MNFYQQPFGGFYPPMMPQYVFADSAIPQPETGVENRQFQQSYIENILRANIGKTATFYMNFEGSQWGSKVFKGTILAAGKDHIIVKESNTETRYLLLLIYLCYVVFEEPISYEYPIRKKADS